ncbi:MAG TPA: protein kinase [Thermoanaerobaculia bacterium]|nr:protein kinase [Thermoanaerobaculia bacterium]
MAIRPGTRLGPYEIVSALGAGAMGEVYRAKDGRLGREAAIKVLPAAYSSDRESLRRFEHEARAASALNHPNIVTVYDIGSAESVSYIAMELVEGRSLQELLASGPMPLRKTLEIGSQIAEGLAAAHAKGLVHRDLKPQNLMVTKEGHVKILDFGLAKLASPATLDSPEQAPAGASSLLTTPGTILGTVGYMSPEQARGEPADFRSDQFALGVILYEMAVGKRAFDRGSAIETLSAILRDEPSPLEVSDPSLPGPFCWVVERCLVKEPEGRYASTRDLAFDLKSLWDHISRPSGSSTPTPATAPRHSLARRALVPLAVLCGLALGALAVTRLSPAPAPPNFQPLTFRRGTIWSARFAPDGRTVVYAAAWDGKPFRLFRRGPGSAAEQRLSFPDANLLAVSRSGELAAALRYRIVPPGMTVGMLARAPLEGGAPREIEGDVLFADWAPDGKDLALVRTVAESGKAVLEFPIGAKIYETNGLVTFPRVSPDGSLVAFLDHPSRGDNRGSVAVVDRAGRKRVLTPPWTGAEGLAWHPSGNEIWFGAAKEREFHAIHAVTLSGKMRVVARAPGNLSVRDISPAGRVLVTRDIAPIGIMARSRGEPAERDFSWLDRSLLTDLSADGESLLFTQFGLDAAYAGFLRRVNAEGPMALGDGFALSLSPDGSGVLSIVPSMPPQLYVLPTGAGQPRKIVPRGLEIIQRASWFPDGKHIAIGGAEPGRGMRVYSCNVESGQTRALTPEGILLDDYEGIPVSPDGKRLAAMRSDGRLAVFPSEGGEGRPIPELPEGMSPIGWTADSRSLFVVRLGEAPARVFRVDSETGEKTLWRELALADPAGVQGFPSVRVSPDGSAYAYSFMRFLSELYAVDGLK